jgi:glycosyltransferase involved in cell wall biosynthesis
MSALHFSDLPRSPEGKTGWPWDEASLPVSQSHEAPSWPKISIVTPNYNYGKFIEQTIRSVLLQGYPHIEYIIVDGGSTDDSLNIIKKYERWLTFWNISPGRSQTRAINEGYQIATGDVLNWLCSDDFLLPGALHRIGACFMGSPETDVVAGRGRNVHLDSHQTWDFQPRDTHLIPLRVPCMQPGCFYKRKLLDRPGPLDESYSYLMDLELWAYFRSRNARWKIIDDLLCVSQVGHGNKTSTGGAKITYEHERIYKAYVKEWIPLTFWYRLLVFPLEKILVKHEGRFWEALGRAIKCLFVMIFGVFYGFYRARVMSWRWIL